MKLRGCVTCEGVAGVEAEAELLAAMVTFFQRVGLTSRDVVIKVSSRQVLQAVLEEHQVPTEASSRVFVTVDKMDKLPKETVSFRTSLAFLIAVSLCCLCTSQAAQTNGKFPYITCFAQLPF